MHPAIPHEVSEALRRLSLSVGLCLIAGLSACGGGSSDDDKPTTTPSSIPASVIDVYVGSWVSDCEALESASARRRWDVTKLAVDRLKLAYSYETYTTTNCTGSATRSREGYEEETYMGTKVVDGKTVHKFATKDFTNNFEYKFIGLIEGNKFYSGDDESDVDADGYPNALDMDFWVTKL
jgi:hypothetical protein